MDMDIGDEAELEQELENELIEEILDESAIEDAEFAAEEAAYNSQQYKRRSKRGLPNLRIGLPGASGKQRLPKRQIADEFGLEDLGFADTGDMDDAEVEAIEEIMQEIEAEEAAEEAAEESSGGLTDDYDEVTPTSTSVHTKPTSSYKRPSAGLGSSTVESSSNIVPVYNGPITYAVPKTGYYCVGPYILLLKIFHADARTDRRRSRYLGQFEEAIFCPNPGPTSRPRGILWVYLVQECLQGRAAGCRVPQDWRKC